MRSTAVSISSLFSSFEPENGCELTKTPRVAQQSEANTETINPSLLNMSMTNYGLRGRSFEDEEEAAFFSNGPIMIE